jgi:glucose/arabinose dehydrogenase
VLTLTSRRRATLELPRSVRLAAVRLALPAFAALAIVACTSLPASQTPSGAATPQATPSRALDVAVVQDGLSIPWDIAFAPDGRMVVSERPGRIRIYASGEPGAELLATIEVPDVRAVGEAGVMGMDFDANFDEFPFLYVCASRDADGEDGDAPWRNELLRFRLTGDALTLEGTVFESRVRANRQHNGCAVETDAEGHIWMTVGDALQGRRGGPQLDNLNGKVLRMNRDGTAPEDNPTLFGRVGLPYTIGHRNPQGIALDPDGGPPYTAEHGPNVNDEINRLGAGGNYGWPCYTGEDTLPVDIGGHEALEIECGPPSDYLPPAWASGDATIATSGLVFLDGDAWGPWDGNLVVAALKERELRRFEVNDDGTLELAETLLNEEFGRLRAAVIGPDGALYVTTSNARNLSKEGMTPAPENENDVIIRIAPASP